MTGERTPGGSGLHIFIVAGEESGDALGAGLMRALRAQRPDIRFSGVGGEAMEREGLTSLFPVSELSLIGLIEVARRLPRLLARIRETARAAIAAAPSALVIIDSPDFTHRVARRVRWGAPAIPVIDYVSPSIWAWRPWRARAMRGYIDHVLALLPFEPAAHADLGGPPCTYVGHPLAARTAELRPDASEFARRLADPPQVLMLPGSRRSEAARLMSAFAGAIDLLAETAGPLDVVLPTVPHLAAQVSRLTEGWAARPRILVEPAAKRAAFRTARAALAASGTVTLELALAGVPTVAGYRVGAVEAAIARQLIRVPSVILANLVLGENVVPEFLQDDCSPQRLAAAMAPLLADTPERRRQVEAFARLDGIMQIGTLDPDTRAAGIVLDHAERAPARARP